jgi:hypothetical protein
MGCGLRKCKRRAQKIHDARLSFDRLAPSFPKGVLRLELHSEGEAAMTYRSQDSVSSPAERSSAIFRGAAFDDGQTAKFLDDAPSADEWRRALAIIAEQVLLRMAGYTDKEEFAKEGCRFLWDRFRSVTGAATHRRQ